MKCEGYECKEKAEYYCTECEVAYCKNCLPLTDVCEVCYEGRMVLIKNKSLHNKEYKMEVKRSGCVHTISGIEESIEILRDAAKKEKIKLKKIDKDLDNVRDLMLKNR